MFLESIAKDIRDALPPGTTVPEDSEYLFLLYALVATSKGTAATLSDIHNAWCVWKFAQDPTHPALVPFSQLPDNLQKEDEPFLQSTLFAAEGLVRNKE